MSNVTVRAAAIGLPKPTDIPSAAVPSRRAFLVGVAAASSPSLALAAAPAAQPVGGALAALLAAARAEENPALLAIGAELPDAQARYSAAIEEAGSRRCRAEATCPLPPGDLRVDETWPLATGPRWQRLDWLPRARDILGREIPDMIVSGKALPAPRVLNVDYLRRRRACILQGGAAINEIQRLMPIAAAYEAAKEQAVEQSGLRDTLLDVWEASIEIARLADQAIEAEARTICGVLIKAQVLATAEASPAEQGNYDSGRSLRGKHDLHASILQVLGAAA